MFQILVRYHSRVYTNLNDLPIHLDEKFHHRRTRTNVRLGKTFPYFAKPQGKATKSSAFVLGFYGTFYSALGLINSRLTEIELII